MKRVWVVEHYRDGRAIAFEMIVGRQQALLGDVVDGPAWIVRLLIAGLG